MFDGSAIATISDWPARFTGMTRCFCATSFFTSLTISGSISKSFRLIAGTPYCLLRKSVSLCSSIAPTLIRAEPIRVPFFCCSSCALRSCWTEIRFSRTSNSPRRPEDMRSLYPLEAGVGWPLAPASSHSSAGRSAMERRSKGSEKKVSRNGRGACQHHPRLLHIPLDLRGELRHRGKPPLGTQSLQELHPDLLPVQIARPVEQVPLHRHRRPTEGRLGPDVGRTAPPPLGRPGPDRVHPGAGKELAVGIHVGGGPPDAPAAPVALHHHPVQVEGPAEQGPRRAHPTLEDVLANA